MSNSEYGLPIPIDGTSISGRDPNGDAQPFLVDAQGNLKVSVTGAGSGGTSSNFDDTFPTAGTAAGGFNVTSGDMKPLVVNDSGELLVAMAGGGSAVTIADGADVAEGATTDVAVVGDNAGTLSAKMRGLSKMVADVWDSVTHALGVKQIGTWSVTATQGTATSLKTQAEVYQGGTAVGAAAPLQVSLANTATNGSPVLVSASSLPLPSGAATLAEQQTQTASLNVMDDWDESDRAKVNLIAGQAGIAGGTGTDGATVPRVTLATNVGLPAGTALLGKVSASVETSTVYDGTTALTPKFAKIAASSSGDNTLVAAVTSKKIRVLAYNFIANGTVNAKFQSGAAGTDLTGLKYCVANMGICAPFSPTGWFESASGVLLNLNLSAGVAVGGELVYVEV